VTHGLLFALWVSPALRNPLFHMPMTQRRYQELASSIHFLCDEDYVDEPRAGHPLYDRTLKVRLVKDRVFAATQRVYKMGKVVTFDETMAASKCKCCMMPCAVLFAVSVPRRDGCGCKSVTDVLFNPHYALRSHSRVLRRQTAQRQETHPGRC
jgi:hypothetical protein